MNPHEREEAEFGFGPRLWDADPDVCCAAFQLGACKHTEGFQEEPTEAQGTRDHFDDNDKPMVCEHCGRPIYYDYADEAYHHAVEPQRGCFLIPAEPVEPF